MNDDKLVGLIRAIVQTTVSETLAKARVPKVLTGVVEDVDDDLDVVYVRMTEGLSDDPLRSDNWEMPGVIPATRIGATYVGEPVRVTFDPSSGASAFQTSAARRLVLPFGEERGRRIELDGEAGSVVFWSASGNPVAFFDPSGGLRMHTETSELLAVFDSNGVSLRDPVTKGVTAELHQGSLRVASPADGDAVEIEASSSATLPHPSVVMYQEASPGSSLITPAAGLFTVPADDIELHHVAAWIAGLTQAATSTPPGGTTEQVDQVVQGPGGTLQVTAATRDPATGAAGTFTSTYPLWQHQIGSHVVLRGGGTVSPTIRSVATAQLTTSENQAVLQVPKPSGVVATDVLVAFVTVATSGGLIPTNWQTPPGVEFHGATFSTSGSGAGQSTLSGGVWIKLAGASEPATYDVDISLPAGLKVLQATTIAVRDCALISGGAQIRMSGRPIRKLLAFNELTAPNVTLCDFQNISQAYDNLQLIVDARVDLNGGTALTRWRIRFNGDTGANYFDRLWGSDGTNVQGFGVTSLRGSVVSAINGNATTGVWDILGYAKPGSQRIIQGRHAWVNNLVLHADTMTGIWGSTAAINRIVVDMPGTPQRYAAGSRVYLYGY